MSKKVVQDSSVRVCFKNVSPDPSQSCGPYTPDELPSKTLQKASEKSSEMYKNDDTLGGDAMDTICQIIIDESGDIVVGTSTNGLSHKVPG